jgi:hypothetical protein
VTEVRDVTTPQPTLARARATLPARGNIEAAADPCPPPLLVSARPHDKEAQMFAPLEMPEPESPESDDDDDIVIADDDPLN